MLKMLRLTLFLLFICCFNAAFSYAVIEKDSLLNFIQLRDKSLREQKLVTYIKFNIQDIPFGGVSRKKDSIASILTAYNTENKDELIRLMDVIYLKRLFKFEEAKKLLVKAIEDAQKKSDHFLLYTFFSQLAFVQTDEGNAIDAIYSYGLAKAEVKKLNNPYLQALLCINISDIYYRSGLYSQSLFYLDEAQEVIDNNKLRQKNILRLVNYNKAENYFRTGDYDSLYKYHKNLTLLPGKKSKLYTAQRRTGYYMLLLKHDYNEAIESIKSLLKDSLYIKDDVDEQQLATAYFTDGQVDSANRVINDLIGRPSLENHPEIKFHLYEMLGEIAQIKNDSKLAAMSLKLALQQSKQNINNLTQVGNVASQMKVNDVQGLYYENLVNYRKEQLKLKFIVALAFLVVVVIAIFYRSNRQKRHYEKLLYTAQKQELANINSHEVRNHLSNIMGLLDLLNDKDSKDAELLKTKDYLQYSAEQLDKALKNVSRKLSD